MILGIILEEKQRYQHRRHNKNLLLVHLIFATKYRKPILCMSLRDDMKRYIYTKPAAITICISRLWRQTMTTCISCCNITQQTASLVLYRF